MRSRPFDDYTYELDGLFQKHYLTFIELCMVQNSRDMHPALVRHGLARGLTIAARLPFSHRPRRAVGRVSDLRVELPETGRPQNHPSPPLRTGTRASASGRVPGIAERPGWAQRYQAAYSRRWPIASRPLSNVKRPEADIGP
jgi:hypothetical protein